MPVLDNMKIFTNTSLVKKAREGVLEFLLVNHPLDCPICDQGGECDLQDLTMAYGSDRGRFHEYKRSVEDKDIGPLVKTIMTRCIHCTRCVRFAAEIAGVPDLGTIGRGRDTEISTYIHKIFNSEVSGNVIDICPVGALTSKPYAFTARPWELQSTESIDISDGVGSNIRVDIRGSEIMRILPRLNEDVNEEWISDKTRFCYDGLKRQRLSNPMIKENGSYRTVSWEQAFEHILRHYGKFKNSNRVFGIIGNLIDVESTYLLKELLNKLGSNRIYHETTTPILSLGNNITEDTLFDKKNGRLGYLFNTTLNGIDDSDFCLLIGANPRKEATIVNLRLRKRYLQGSYKIASFGPKLNLTFPVEDLGNDMNVLQQICEGKHSICKQLSRAKKPMVIVGTSVLRHPDATSILHNILLMNKYMPLYNENWNGFNILHTSASIVGSLDLGIGSNIVKSTNTGDSSESFIYLLGADDIKIINPEKHFIVYQGHHGDYGANIANVILPGAAYTEKTATYVNMEGRVQQTKSSFYAPGNAREDWKILRALSEILNVTLPYNTIDDIRMNFMKIAPHLLQIGEISKSYDNRTSSSVSAELTAYPVTNVSLMPIVDNYYLTNAICRSSQLMAKCSSLYTMD
jgi:NADH-quinone oxidoreductase chain G